MPFVCIPRSQRYLQYLFSVSDSRAISEGNRNRESPNPLPAPRWDSLNEALLFPVKVNSGELCGAERGENSAHPGERLGAGAERCWHLPSSSGCAGMSHEPQSSRVPGGNGAALGGSLSACERLGPLCGTGTPQQVATVLNCWFSKKYSNPNTCPPGGL